MFKQFAIAATAVALTATAASANSYFGIMQGADEGAHNYEVSTVRADGAGVIQIENLQGDILGTAKVSGADTDVKVPLGGLGANGDLIAKLIVDGEVADVERITVR